MWISDGQSGYYNIYTGETSSFDPTVQSTATPGTMPQWDSQTGQWFDPTTQTLTAAGPVANSVLDAQYWNNDLIGDTSQGLGYQSYGTPSPDVNYLQLWEDMRSQLGDVQASSQLMAMAKSGYLQQVSGFDPQHFQATMVPWIERVQKDFNATDFGDFMVPLFMAGLGGMVMSGAGALQGTSSATPALTDTALLDAAGITSTQTPMGLATLGADVGTSALAGNAGTLAAGAGGGFVGTAAGTGLAGAMVPSLTDSQLLTAAGITSTQTPLGMTTLGGEVAASPLAGNTGTIAGGAAGGLTSGIGGAIGGAATQVGSGLLQDMFAPNGQGIDWLGLGSNLIGYNAQQNYQDDLINTMNRAIDYSDPAYAQRPQYQQQFAQMQSDPNWMQNSSWMQNLQNEALRQTAAQSAASGYMNSGNILHDLTRTATEGTAKYAMPYMQMIGEAGGVLGPRQNAASAIGSLGAAAGQAGLGSAQSLQQMLGNVFPSQTGQVANNAINNGINGLLSQWLA